MTRKIRNKMIGGAIFVALFIVLMWGVAFTMHTFFRQWFGMPLVFSEALIAAYILYWLADWLDHVLPVD